MISCCANPACGKPLHYLREGRIYVFETAAAERKAGQRRLEHYWLCGACSPTLALVQDTHGHVHLLPRLHADRETFATAASVRLAS
jgi:hypothetical protein